LTFSVYLDYFQFLEYHVFFVPILLADFSAHQASFLSVRVLFSNKLCLKEFASPDSVVAPDPVDPESMHQALAVQGSLLGQHAQDLKDIMEALGALSSSVVSLSQRLEQRAAPPPPVAVLLSTPSLFEPHLPTLEHYGGDVGACGRFLLQCALVFDLQPWMYQEDCAKVAYITSLLSRRAEQWALATWESNPQLCSSYWRFVAEMRGVFDHPVRGKEAGNRLLSLRQGSSSVADYAIEFSTLATESGWDKSALM